MGEKNRKLQKLFQSLDCWDNRREEKTVSRSMFRTTSIKKRKRIQTRSEVGAIPYQQSIITSIPIGRGLQRMAEKDKKNMRVKLNSTYYLAKKERPFRNYMLKNMLKLQTKNDIPKFGRKLQH